MKTASNQTQYKRMRTSDPKRFMAQLGWVVKMTTLKVLYMYVHVLCHVQLFATPWSIAHQAFLSLGFPRQEYWSGLSFPPPGDLPWIRFRDRTWISFVSCIAGRCFTAEPLEKLRGQRVLGSPPHSRCLQEPCVPEFVSYSTSLTLLCIARLTNQWASEKGAASCSLALSLKSQN